MNRRVLLRGLTATTVGAAGLGAARSAAAAEKSDKAGLRVGVFDSRAIILAYAKTEDFKRHLRGMSEELQKAKAASDEERVKELEAEGPALQKRLHMQGFSTYPVTDVLEHIKEKIPGVAKETGVDVIVSKWDVVFKSRSAEFTDVTYALVKLFIPNEEALKLVKDIQRIPPISIKEAEAIKD